MGVCYSVRCKTCETIYDVGKAHWPCFDRILDVVSEHKGHAYYIADDNDDLLEEEEKWPRVDLEDPNWERRHSLDDALEVLRNGQ